MSTASSAVNARIISCMVDLSVDNLDQTFNHIQMQVKVATNNPVYIGVANAAIPTSSVRSNLINPVGGTATAKWDSSPNTIDADILLIDSGFVVPGEEVTAVAVDSVTSEISPSITVGCSFNARGTL